MKTRMLAKAWERGRVFSRRDQACGFVSRMMVSRDGAGSSHIYTFSSYIWYIGEGKREELPCALVS